MSVIEIVSSTKGKCISCRFYECDDGDWTSGTCANEDAKVKNRYRWYNSKICQGFSRKRPSEAPHD